MSEQVRSESYRWLPDQFVGTYRTDCETGETRLVAVRCPTAAWLQWGPAVVKEHPHLERVTLTDKEPPSLGEGRYAWYGPATVPSCPAHLPEELWDRLPLPNYFRAGDQQAIYGSRDAADYALGRAALALARAEVEQAPAPKPAAPASAVLEQARQMTADAGVPPLLEQIEQNRLQWLKLIVGQLTDEQLAAVGLMRVPPPGYRLVEVRHEENVMTGEFLVRHRFKVTLEELAPDAESDEAAQRELSARALAANMGVAVGPLSPETEAHLRREYVDPEPDPPAVVEGQP